MERINAMGERTRRAIVRHLTRKTPKTITELVDETGITRGTVRYQLIQLRKLNLVKDQRHHLADRGTRYWLTKIGEDVQHEWENR